MSAIVQQLSYNINEKLHLDDRTFTQYEARSSSEHPGRSTSGSTSFTTKETTDQWTTTAVTSTPASITSSENRFVGSSGFVVGQTGQRFDHHRLLSIHRSEIPPSTLPKAKDTTETTLYKLRDSCPQKTFFTLNQLEKVQPSKSSTDFNTRCTGINTQGTDSFPSIVGRSCTLHPPKDQSHSIGSSAAFSDVPPIKKHCRSVSELDDIGACWKPSTQTHVWVPIQRLRSTRKSFSSYPCSGRVVGDCSRSLDCGSLQLTPPASPVPRPASVTVIKQEGGTWTFLSSQKVLSDQSTAFSPLGLASPLSRLQTVGSRASTHSGLSATKRSLSFSADFEHRESIEYTPASTPEFGKRHDHELKRGGLLRCQSHPSGLNIKRGKCRRRSRLSNNRPTLDFAKMRQTSFAKCRGDEFNRTSASAKAGFALSNDIGQILSVNPVFPSIINSDNSLKKNKAKNLEPMRCLSPTSIPVSFSIGCGKPLSNIEHRIPSPTDEALNEPDEDLADCEIDVETTSGGVSPSFIPECPDLNVDEIENEDDV